MGQKFTAFLTSVQNLSPHDWSVQMAAMKPRTGDGPMEVVKEGRSIIMRVPLEGGGRLVVELNQNEANELGKLSK